MVIETMIVNSAIDNVMRRDGLAHHLILQRYLNDIQD